MGTPGRPDDKLREAIQHCGAARDCFVAEPVIGLRDFARARWLLAMTASQSSFPLASKNG
jgi:hypothetical protein